MGDRIYSLDTVKGLALLMVFFLHARWPNVGSSVNTQSIEFILLSLSRLAVPLFFLTSGYLLKMKLETRETPQEEWRYCKKFLKKIGFYYVIASIIFLALKLVAVSVNRYLKLEEVSRSVSLNLQWPDILFHIFYSGKIGGDHIWFLLALFYSVLLIYLFYRYGQFKKLLAGAIALHVIGILSRAYMILDQLPVPRDDLLFFGLAFTCLGFYVRDKNLAQKKSTQFFLKAALVTNILHISERLFLTFSSINAQQPFFWMNYSFLTAPAAITIFLYVLRRKDFGKNSRINEYGQQTLWIYILHIVALGLLIGTVSLLNPFPGFKAMENFFFTILVTLVGYFGSAEIILTVLSSRNRKPEEKN